MAPNPLEMLMRFIVITAAIVFSFSSAHAQSPAEQRGLTFAEANCALCHAVGTFGDSPLPLAPPFRTLNERYDDLDKLAEPLAEGTVSGHPSMPQFHLDGAQIADLLAYLHSINPPDE